MAVAVSRSARGIMAVVRKEQVVESKQMEVGDTMAEPVEVEQPKHLGGQARLDYTLAVPLVEEDILYPKEVAPFHLQAVLMVCPPLLPLMEHHRLLLHNEQPRHLVESLAFHISQYLYSLYQVSHSAPW